MLRTLSPALLAFLTSQGSEGLSQNTAGSSVPQPAMSLRQIVFLISYYLCLGILGLSQLMALWPESQHLGEKSEVSLFWRKTSLSRELHLALLVILTALLGDLAKDLWWLGVGYKEAWRFIAYFTHPWVAVTVALIFYGLLRGGLISGPGGAKEINAYGIVGVSGVVGIFAETVLSKLGGVLT